ncbi:MAG: hypothetical protein MHM6MM_002970 [Cercozoa sp. M6MM]
MITSAWRSISVDGLSVVGGVIDVHLRATTLRATDRAMWSMPNRYFINSPIYNYSRRDKSQVKLQIRVWLPSSANGSTRLKRFVDRVNKSLNATDGLVLADIERPHWIWVTEWEEPAPIAIPPQRGGNPSDVVLATPLHLEVRAALPAPVRSLFDEDKARMVITGIVFAAASDAEITVDMREQVPSAVESSNSNHHTRKSARKSDRRSRRQRHKSREHSLEHEDTVRRRERERQREYENRGGAARPLDELLETDVS